MDKVKQYSKIIQLELEKRAAVPFANDSNLYGHLVINKDATEFIWLNIGWRFPEFVHTVAVHLAIEGDKVKFFANNTDIDFGNVFAEKGILKSDMIIEFVAPIERDLEYAR